MTDRMFEVFNPTTGKVYGFFVGPAVVDVLEEAILTIDADELANTILDAREVTSDTPYTRED